MLALVRCLSSWYNHDDNDDDRVVNSKRLSSFVNDPLLTRTLCARKDDDEDNDNLGCLSEFLGDCDDDDDDDDG